MTVFILTLRRSGSSFFGTTMSQHPEIFFHFEPLIDLGEKYFESGPELESALSQMKTLSECQFSDVEEYIKAVRQGTWFEYNPKINADECKRFGIKNSCYSADFLTAACQIFPVQLMKVVRLRGRAGREILEKFNNSRLIYLMRDPRGTWASRLNVTFCGEGSICGTISDLCQALDQDLQEIKYVQSFHKSKVQVIKYEDVVQNPVGTFKEIFKKLGMSWSVDIENYIQIHTNTTNSSLSSDPYSLFRVSKEREKGWQKALSWSSVEEVQAKCRNFMMDMKYEFVNSSHFHELVET